MPINANKPSESEKRDSFKKLAKIRLSNALKSIKLLGNLANPRAYKYSNEDITTIKREINNALRDMESAYKANSKKTLQEENFFK